MAIDALRDYETKYHLNKVVTVRMEKAEEVDKSSSEFLNRLKERFCVRKKLALFCRHTDVDYQPMKEEPTKIVEFHIHKSLPDSHPAIEKRERRLTKVAHGYLTSIPEVLSKPVNLNEVLWNFSRYTGKEREKRLTLKQSPHFYKSLPRAPRDYGDDFQSDPIENFLDTPEHKIFVLINRQGRVYLESEKDPRAFGNVWCPQRAIIFKGLFLAFSKFAHLDTSLDNL